MNDIERWNNIWNQSEIFHEAGVFDCVVEALKDNIDKNIAGLKILEAGAGTGTTSFWLAKLGAWPTLVDYSPVAIEKMTAMFARNNLPAKFLRDDIKQMSVEADSYDLVFNSGVMEHFSYQEQVEILLELKRVCKPGGKIILFTPNAKCLFYRLYKWLCETNDVWQWGPEYPITSLKKQFKGAGLKMQREYSVGFLESLKHLEAIEGTQILSALFRAFHDNLPKEEKNLFEGYLVCSIGTKKNTGGGKSCPQDADTGQSTKPR